MRWLERRDGEIRFIKKFLLIPRCINGEWRWLEKAEWKQVYHIWGDGSKNWLNKEWINE